MTETYKCCICKANCIGWGNNAAPVVASGTCCDGCNYGVVIPARIGAANPVPRTWTDAHVAAAVAEIQAAATYWAKPRKASRKPRRK